MVKNFMQSIKAVASDRGFLAMILGVVLLGVIYTIITLLSIRGSDIQLVVQYSAFGESHFYKNQWVYLYSFSLFGLLVTLAHSALMVKFYKYGRRNAGLMLGWTTIAILFVAFIIFKSVTQLSFI